MSKSKVVYQQRGPAASSAAQRVRRAGRLVAVLLAVAFANANVVGTLAGLGAPPPQRQPVPPTSVVARNCAEATNLAPVSAAASVWLEERDAWNRRYLVRRDSMRAAALSASKELPRAAWPEVDPRSTLVVHFASSDPCAPPFKIRLRGTIRKQSGSSRSLEIPRYFQAGVAQAEPQSRTFALRSATRILKGVPVELALALQASRTPPSPRSPPNGPGSSDRHAAALRDTLASIRDATIRHERLRISQIDSGARYTARAQVNRQDNTADSAAAVLQRSVYFLTSRLDSLREAQSQLWQQLSADDRKQQLAASEDELRQLLSLPQTQLAIRLLRQPSYAPALREFAAHVEAEHITLDSMLARLDGALTSGAAMLQKKDAQQLEVAAIAAIREATSQLRRAETALLPVVTLAAVKPISGIGSEDPLMLPDAEIPLRGSSASEGEQVSLEITFIADDGEILESATYELSVLRLGGAVRNIRDVALFLNRCTGGISFGKPCRTSVPSVDSTARSIRAKLLGDQMTRLDLLRIDAFEHSAEIPAQDRFVPAPGVVFEALFRPRVLDSDCRFQRIVKKTVRALGISAGVSVSFVSYTDRKVTLNLPTTDQLRAYYAEPDTARRSAAADTLFRLGSSDITRQDLSIAPAVHLGLFDGAFSLAFGANLRAREGRFFYAVGFSFLGLTEAGAKLLGSIKAN